MRGPKAGGAGCVSHMWYNSAHGKKLESDAALHPAIRGMDGIDVRPAPDSAFLRDPVRSDAVRGHCVPAPLAERRRISRSGNRMLQAQIPHVGPGRRWRYCRRSRLRAVDMASGMALPRAGCARSIALRPFRLRLVSIAKLIGSAFIIAPVEEVFFRSFLYRWLIARDFRAVPLSRFDLSAFLWMILLFTLEHDRPVAAAITGALYGLLAIKAGLGSAIAAHVTTNLLLGLHVIHHNAWQFW